ncbi:hypothetical protein AOLI_G00232410 [Acnodon oligacanthus]
MKLIQLWAVVLLALHLTAARNAGAQSLWGLKAILQRSDCQYWMLNPDHSLPALEEFSICVNVQRSINNSAWTAFTYVHPDQSRVELGLGGRGGKLHIWLFGMYRTVPDTLTVGQWCSICITWSCSTKQLQLFINGSNAVVMDVQPEDSTCGLSAGGSLTLGAAHYFTGGMMEVESGTNLQGNITLFRVWRKIRSPELHSAHSCTDGDALRWHGRVWNAHSCPAEKDDTLTCDLLDPTGKQEMFDALAHLTVIPSDDVGKVQDLVYERLSNEFYTDNYHVYPVKELLHIYSIDGDEVPKSTSKPINSTPNPTDTNTKPSITTILDSFFKVSVNVTIEESEVDPADTIQTWLYGTLSANGISVLNFHFISPQTRTVRLKKRSNEVKEALVFTEESTDVVSVRLNAVLTDSPAPSHSCMFQMLVPKCSDVEETQRQIHDLLEKPYSNGSMRLDADPENIFISHIEPGLCPQLTQQTRQGRYVWPWTPAQRTAWQHCEADKDCLAFRQCLLSADTSQAAWVSPELQRCPTVVATISDLEQIEVTRDTAEDVLQMIVDILKEHDSLDKCDLQTVLNKLQEVLNITTVTRDLAEVIVSIMSNILNSKSDLQPFTNDILNITDTVGVELSNFIGESDTVVAPGLALSVVTVDPENTNNLTFGVTSVNDGPYPTIYINKDPYEGTVAFISLPSALHASFPPRNSTNPRVQFQFYGVPALFKDGESGQSLNTYVVSASVINVAEPVENLKEPVIVTLHHLDTQITGKEVHCVYWDFNKNGGCGGWSPRGCWKHNGTLEYTTCMCDHLTHFGVLLDVSRTPIDEENEKILTVISYVGCGLSSFFLGVTVLTYSLLDKLRRDYPSQILLNLSIALLGLNLVFLTNSWFSAFAVYGLCVAVAAAQHYFLLASFSWMLLEAVNMYFALVKVFNVYVPSYILKFCIVGWGAPLVICCLVLVVKQEAYAVTSFTDQDTLEDSEMFCWIQDDVVFFVSVVGFIGLVLLCNFSIFLVVLLQMKKMRVNQPAGTHRSLLKDLRGVASFTLLLGLTWAVAFFTWGPAKVPLLYLFSILNSLQGSFIFIFHCLMKENVRKQWRIHLCFGRFKLQDQSDWSHTATVVAKPKRSRFPKFPTVASFRSSKSNSTQSSSLSSDSSQPQDSIRRPNLDVMYQQSLVLPRIRLTPSAPPSANANGDLPEAEGYEVRSWIPAERSSSVHYN